MLYEFRITDFVKKHVGPKVGFVQINPNNQERDRLPQMKVRAREQGWDFPYLYDPSQKIARDLGATLTPEFYVFNKDRKLVYQGAMSLNPAALTVNYLEDSVQAALTGKPYSGGRPAHG